MMGLSPNMRNYLTKPKLIGICDLLFYNFNI